ncbi:hypothetical protein ACOQFV_10420 [Nocardiopsis changdeensis]|uniref:Uncharacterized protein n=1 Tax=Nocardiopsis changdeensis TaxID=2831969 RepID=A0ABX8BU18_9ACTN|nr:MULTISPECIES: hypothetical protein [Nocardiopsis]QUX25368.1 hypothetical protein KGD84_14615 [Nocardiopsis changdeensis]QYX35754.1 hypothetical protein K1J57_24070 [Nocardiopsis sp. MT53]
MDVVRAPVRAWAEEILRGLGDPPLRDLVVESRPESGEVEVVLWFPDGTAAGSYLQAAMTDAEAVVHLADGLQDAAVEQALGRPLPPCPGHPHPPTARLVSGVPAWTCPRTGGAVRPILTPP